MLTDRLRNRHFLFLDLVLLASAVYVSYVLRLDVLDPGRYRLGMIGFGVVALVTIPSVLRAAGIYSRYWRYASIDELLRLSIAVGLGSLVAGAVALIAFPLLSETLLVPRSIPLIFLPLALIATAAPRLVVRIAGQYRKRAGKYKRIKIVAIMGAGDAGVMIARELHNNPHLGIEVAGFLDDDESKHDMRIHGIPVMGDRTSIPRIVRNYNLHQVIIAMPTAPGRDIREVVAICEEAGVETKIIPGIYELLNGAVSINQIRDVDIEDLLRREPIETDTAAVEQFLHGKRVLVTGAGGSIGSEVCRQIIRCGPQELMLLGHGENSIFEILQELSALDPDRHLLTPIITDTRFDKRIDAVFEQYRPQIVFHAAAHKHVPLMENNPVEAVTNNVLGTLNLLEAAKAHDVEQFVMVSTDKAVNPSSVMGSTKRIAELLVHQAARETGRPYVTVRFGNVLGSRGSVILTFKKQIAKGGPVTVTHPEMKRYFMTITEAVQLLLQATVLGKGGEVFMLDMGQPVKIVDLARDLIELSGLEVGRDIDIKYTGVRPGEKLFEELFIKGEEYKRTRHQQIFIAANASAFVPPRLSEDVQDLLCVAESNDPDALLGDMMALVPEYDPSVAGEPLDETGPSSEAVPVDGSFGAGSD